MREIILNGGKISYCNKGKIMNNESANHSTLDQQLSGTPYR